MCRCRHPRTDWLASLGALVNESLTSDSLSDSHFANKRVNSRLLAHRKPRKPWQTDKSVMGLRKLMHFFVFDSVISGISRFLTAHQFRPLQNRWHMHGTCRTLVLLCQRCTFQPSNTYKNTYKNTYRENTYSSYQCLSYYITIDPLV